MLSRASTAAVANNVALRSELLHEFFERQADLRPQGIAVCCGLDELSYGELERRANQLAHFLRAHNIGRGHCVGLLLPRSADVYVALLAILKTGAAYVPLDPEYPAERIQFILSDCHAAALVTASDLASVAAPVSSLTDPNSSRNAGGDADAPGSAGPRAGSWTGPVFLLDELRELLAGHSSQRLVLAEHAPTPADLCYLIYTSGTTGRPKGVQIEHRSVCHLVRAEGEIFRVQPEDRVYQGFSLAFDASVEEIWLALYAGATLVAATPEMARSGPALAGKLAEAGVTVLSCVPTLLAMMEQDAPLVRLLILGGEVCPPDLVKRWWKPGRRVVNTYGPTEATVIATYADCHPEKPVTIGRPLPGYSACLVDAHLQPVADGAAGELCLGGIGLARGYVGRPELTREKFVSLPQARGQPAPVSSQPAAPTDAAPAPSCAGTVYRTGDLARWTPQGELEFLGRLDGQIKLRGFRIELSEIESVLMDCAGIRAAAVALREDVPGVQQLVAYVVPRDGEMLDTGELRTRMRSRLPPYMVQARIVALTELPTLPSGKVDRKSLPAPSGAPAETPRASQPPRTPLERRLAVAWERLFASTPVSATDDFFLDLGGHSLLAARMVSELRKAPPFDQLSMLDIYQHPTIESLAAEFESRQGRGATPVAPPPSPLDPGSAPPTSRPPTSGARESAVTGSASDQNSTLKNQESPLSTPHSALRTFARRHFLCGVAQLASLVFILSFFALQWLAPYLTYTLLIEEEYDFLPALLGAFASLVLVYPVMLVIPIAAKWLLIGRYLPGEYPLWGNYYFRWWLATTIEAAVPVSYLSGTPLLGIYLRLMGARVGRNVVLNSDSFAAYDLLSIGDHSSINADANLLGYAVENGLLKIGRISIGRSCFVGARATVGIDCVMEDESELEDLSLLPRGSTIPRGETWRGSPATRGAGFQTCSRRGGTDFQAGTSAATSQIREPGASIPPEPREPALPAPSFARRFLFGLLHGLGLLAFPSLVVAALFPGIVVMNHLNYLDPYYWYLLLSPLVGVSFVVLLCLEIAAIKWLLVGRVEPGRHPVHSFFYLRKWFVDQTMELSLDILGPLYASVYLVPWYRLLGAKLGAGAEISTASFISPDLLSIGDESFIADSVSLGAPRVRGGVMSIGRNHIGRRSFIGNSALLPPDTVIGDNILIGCLSTPPERAADALREDTAWLGAPALFLPQREKSAAFTEETTFHPSAKLRALRAAIEFVRVTLPATGFIILLSLLFSALLLLHDVYSWWQTLCFFPALYLGCGLTAMCFTIAAKWLLVGRYRPGEKPLWSTFVWRNELLNALHEHLAQPFLVGMLTGTPFLCWYFRLLGARIGRRVYLETADFSEFDLVRIGYEAALNADCTIQTHLFEDRVMKMSTIDIGPRCTVGASSLVLYDTCMEEGSTLGDLSLLMKGETLPARTQWHGIPARAVSSSSS